MKKLSLALLVFIFGLMTGCGDNYANLIRISEISRSPEIVFNSCANKYAVQIGSGKYSFFGKFSNSFDSWFVPLGEEYQFDTKEQAALAWNKYAVIENAQLVKSRKEKHPEDDPDFKCQHSYQ